MHTKERDTCCPTPRSSRRKSNVVECEYCGLYGMCQVAGLEAPVPALIDEIVGRREPVAIGQNVITAGTPFGEIYAVKSGSFKTYLTLANGEQQIIDFYFPGELMGLEGLSRGTYPHMVEALEASSVCRLDFAKVNLLGERLGEFQQQLINALSKRTRQDQWVPLLMGAQNAEQRTATFLLSLSARFAEHDLPSVRFKLPMSRHDIANYLGLAVETVSRMFQRFQTMELLEVHGRHVELRDIDALRVIAGLNSIDAT
ncbi:helix-turn-helix domain-containing protein [Sulfurivermis fontis]|uniref:helix-turn-helix domain-containing protein n=1 Tax=Sulfurivermis fontis TaxID=1972068 RepID=UPI0015595BC2|nr:helix-turn-helix domain-containing protein [Sulfurivermis fontis]